MMFDSKSVLYCNNHWRWGLSNLLKRVPVKTMVSAKTMVDLIAGHKGITTWKHFI